MSESIVTQLFERAEKEGIKITRLSEILDIPQDRIYKWRSSGSGPKAVDAEKIRKWLSTANPKSGGLIFGAEGSGKSKTAMDLINESNEYREKYIQLLEKQLDTANSQLTTALQTISTSLKEIVELQRVDVAQSKTLLQLEAEREAHGDRRKEEQALDKINKRLASNLVK